MAREGYLVNAGTDTIHDPEAEKKALQKNRTPKGKWQNFWYYHKWHVLIGVFVLLVVIYSAVNQFNTVKPDYNVGMIVTKAYPDSVTEALGNEMAKYGKDLNGDGKTSVQVNQYVIPPEESPGAASSVSGMNRTTSGMDPQLMLAYHTKFIGDLTTGTSIIFLTDDASFLAQEKGGNHMFAYLDGKTPYDNATDYDKMRISFSKTKLKNVKFSISTLDDTITEQGEDLFGDTSFSLRTYYGSEIEDKENDYFQASKELLEKLKAAS